MALSGAIVDGSVYSVSNVITQSPGSGKINTAVYSPAEAPAFTWSVLQGLGQRVARILGFTLASGSNDGAHTLKAKFSGCPATAKSGKSFNVTISQPPAYVTGTRENRATNPDMTLNADGMFMATPSTVFFYVKSDLADDQSIAWN